MRRHSWKRILSCLLVVVMMVTMFPSSIAEGADGEVTVEIESFIRGTSDELRSSELLVAKVEGYDGHASELTYKWTNDLGTSEKNWFWTSYYGTYLYVYDSHNMYTVQGTASEQEIYNSERNVEMSDNMTEENSHDKTFSGIGYMYAAVYGADLNEKDYSTGSITVEVYEGDSLLCSDTYGDEVNEVFCAPDLEEDLENAAFGVFEGETVDVKDLLGESAILHVNCTACTVTAAQITSGEKCITVEGSTPNYTVTGIEKGTAAITISVTKENCKFHQYSEKTATPKVYVFKKPIVTPGLTTLTLTNLDEDCTYYINHVEGVRSADNQTVVFKGLEPSTTYEIEVKGRYYTEQQEEKFAYAFVNGTTLTPRTVGIMTLLDLNVVKSEEVGIESLYLQNVDLEGNLIGEKIPLTYNETSHNYTAQVADGAYWVYDQDGNRLGRSMELVVNGSDTSGTLSHFSVNYDVNGGNELENTVNPTAYFVGSMVHATNEIPTREGYYFTGWKYNNTIYSAGSLVSAGINGVITLTAQWEEAVDVYVNFEIDHISDDGSGHNNDKGKHDVTFTVDGRAIGSVGDYTEMVHKTIEWDEGSEFDVAGYELTYNTPSQNADTTVYTAKTPTFKDLPSDMEYIVTTAKSGYAIKSIESSTDENGDVFLKVVLVYDPNEFDFVFEVELDSNAKELPTEMKPVAANVKVLMWHDSPYVDGEGVGWYTITQQYDTYEQVNIDPTTGKGTGTYPVWIATTDTSTPYFYRIEVVSYLMPDGSIIGAADKGNKHIEYVSADERYTATIEVTDGHIPTGSELAGARYIDLTDDGAGNPKQEGQVKAIISIKKPTLTLIANGGTIGNTSETSTKIEGIITVPSLTEYKPIREGYIFGGWYDTNDNEIVEGMSMTTDVTAYARWIETITISGEVTVQNYYYNNEIKTLINEIDRVKDTTVILRRRVEGATNFVTVAETIVAFADTQQDESITTFEFTNLPKTTNGKVEYEYIVVVRQANYDKIYNPEFKYLAYNVSGQTEQRVAAKPTIEDNKGTATIELVFAPDSFKVPYKVDVTQIADPTCRPTSVKVVYEYAIANSDFLVWNTITQHDANQGHSPLTSIFDSDGYACSKEGEYPVWSQTPDGKYEYFYRLKVVSYTLNGAEIIVGSAEDKLFNIYYGSPITVSSTDSTVTATFSPLPLELTLDTGIEGAHINTSGYTDMGTSTIGGEKYNRQFVYGTGVDSFPTPVKEEYSFLGWYNSKNEQVTSIPSDTTESVYLTAKWEKGFTVNFLSNNPDAEKAIFRTYYAPEITLPEGERFFHLSESNTIPKYFYDIPVLDYGENNKYIFKGWYLDQDSDDNPLTWDTVFKEETNIYAHWIEVGTVEQDETDTKESDNNGVYNEYDLIGAQIREAENDSEEHYGTAGSGLRFITVLSETVYEEINNLYTPDSSESVDAEYGFVLANASKAQTNAESSGDEANYQLQYNSKNVNGVDTSTSYGYAKNIKCSGVKDHFNCNDYRLYTAVVTYKNKTGEALTNAQATKLLARPYIRYYDANGLYRTYYNNYTGTPTYHGLSTSYSQIYEILNETK